MDSVQMARYIVCYQTTLGPSAASQPTSSGKHSYIAGGFGCRKPVELRFVDHLADCCSKAPTRLICDQKQVKLEDSKASVHLKTLI